MANAPPFWGVRLVRVCPPAWEQNVSGPEATTKPTLMSHNDIGEVGGIKMLRGCSNEPPMPKTLQNEVRKTGLNFLILPQKKMVLTLKSSLQSVLNLTELYFVPKITAWKHFSGQPHYLSLLWVAQCWLTLSLLLFMYVLEKRSYSSLNSTI